jgi:hypothetical protein
MQWMQLLSLAVVLSLSSAAAAAPPPTSAALLAATLVSHAALQVAVAHAGGVNGAFHTSAQNVFCVCRSRTSQS